MKTQPAPLFLRPEVCGNMSRTEKMCPNDKNDRCQKYQGHKVGWFTLIEAIWHISTPISPFFLRKTEIADNFHIVMITRKQIMRIWRWSKLLPARKQTMEKKTGLSFKCSQPQNNITVFVDESMKHKGGSYHHHHWVMFSHSTKGKKWSKK